MKKFLSIILAVFCITVQAKETVTIYYSWSPADVAANFYRALTVEANKIQDKYTFVFDTKPGAGGSVAAAYILSNPQSNLLLANSSSFFIRPNFFSVAESHDINTFKELAPQCIAPVVIASKKYRSWADVPADKPLTIGISGMGTTTHIVSLQLLKKYPNLNIIPFKSTSDALISVLGDNTDFATVFLGDIAQYSEGKNKMYALGIGGSQTINGIEPLSRQGFSKDLEVMNAPHQVLVPATVSDVKFKEWRKILLEAGRSQAVLDSYKPDHCQSINQMSDTEIQPWYFKQKDDWKRLTQGVKLN
jgi:tripartite-type tricarboxylate transporter receptor subunit TctC